MALVKDKQRNCLVIFLHAGGGHAVDDRVTTGVHVCNGVGNGQQGESEHNAEPQDNVEDDRVITVVHYGEVKIVRLKKAEIISFIDQKEDLMALTISSPLAETARLDRMSMSSLLSTIANTASYS